MNQSGVRLARTWLFPGWPSNLADINHFLLLTLEPAKAKELMVPKDRFAQWKWQRNTGDSHKPCVVHYETLGIRMRQTDLRVEEWKSKGWQVACPEIRKRSYGRFCADVEPFAPFIIHNHIDLVWRCLKYIFVYIYIGIKHSTTELCVQRCSAAATQVMKYKAKRDPMQLENFIPLPVLKITISRKILRKGIAKDFYLSIACSTRMIHLKVAHFGHVLWADMGWSREDVL